MVKAWSCCDLRDPCFLMQHAAVELSVRSRVGLFFSFGRKCRTDRCILFNSSQFIDFLRSSFGHMPETPCGSKIPPQPERLASVIRIVRGVGIAIGTDVDR